MTQTEPLAPDFGEAWVTTLIDTLLTHLEAIGDLDRRSGDGDFGDNLSAALRGARTRIDEDRPSTYREWVTALSLGFLDTGGTSGPLFGMFFRSFAQEADPDATADTAATLAEFSAGLTRGVETIRHYGKATVGDKTMVDALAPAAETLAAESTAGTAPADALPRTAAAAVDGARSTADILARRGRASYVGEVARGVLDPGAVAAALMIQAAAAAQNTTGKPSPGDTIDTGWFAG